MTDSQGADGVVLLRESRIQFADEAMDWRSAITLVGAPLVAEGAVSEGYVSESIAIAERNGPFFHLGRGIAMPHARPEAGANDVALSFLRTRTPVLLLDKEEHAIDVFFMLAATDDQSHLDLLRVLAEILTDEAKVEQLKAATTAAAVLAIVNPS